MISCLEASLSFAEYLEFKYSSSLSRKELLAEYIRLGGFPIVARGDFDERSAYQIVEGIYNSAITVPAHGQILVPQPVEGIAKFPLFLRRCQRP